MYSLFSKWIITNSCFLMLILEFIVLVFLSATATFFTCLPPPSVVTNWEQSRVEWFFSEKIWTHFKLCQIFMGPQFQNFTLKCCFLAWHRVSENFGCYPKMGNFFLKFLKVAPEAKNEEKLNFFIYFSFVQVKNYFASVHWCKWQEFANFRKNIHFKGPCEFFENENFADFLKLNS